MCGPANSILGRAIEPIVNRFISNLPALFPVAKGDVRLCGAVVSIDETTGRAPEHHAGKRIDFGNAGDLFGNLSRVAASRGPLIRVKRGRVGSRPETIGKMLDSTQLKSRPLFRALSLLWSRMGPARLYVLAGAIVLLILAALGVVHLLSSASRHAPGPLTRSPRSPAEVAPVTRRGHRDHRNWVDRNEGPQRPEKCGGENRSRSAPKHPQRRSRDSGFLFRPDGGQRDAADRSGGEL